MSEKRIVLNNLMISATNQKYLNTAAIAELQRLCTSQEVDQALFRGVKLYPDSGSGGFILHTLSDGKRKDMPNYIRGRWV